MTGSCDIGSATPIAPSAEGTRTYQLIESIDPRYAGSFIDVFPGGCITSTYDFERGPHVALVTELQRAVDVYSRRQLRQELRVDLGCRSIRSGTATGNARTFASAMRPRSSIEWMAPRRCGDD